jgi:hypothetical protein
MPGSYASPDVVISRERYAGACGGAATTEYGKFRSFQAAKLEKVHVVVTTAGTATTHKLDIYHGTSSIGTIALSTNTGTFHSALLSEALASMDQISVKTGADAAGIADVVYEYHVTPDAVETEP